MASINFSDDGGPHETGSGLREAQQCLKASAALQPNVEQVGQFQSTIQLLREALDASSSQVAALEIKLHCRSEELEAVKKENERVTAELNQIKAGNSETTSRINGIMKTVGGFFVCHRNI